MTTVSTGRTNEQRATDLLTSRGYHIVARNFRCKAGELDVIAIDRDTLVFVEVRSRADARYGGALFAVGPRKRQQVARVARAYLATNPTSLRNVRFDIV